MEERRTTQRRRVLKAGTIAFGQAAGIDCVVKNMSEKGALLSVTTSVGIPDSFTLLIPHDQLQRPVRVIWRRAQSVGVVFED
jgi:hypothetical protein